MKKSSIEKRSGEGKSTPRFPATHSTRPPICVIFLASCLRTSNISVLRFLALKMPSSRRVGGLRRMPRYGFDEFLCDCYLRALFQQHLHRLEGVHVALYPGLFPQ